MNSPRIQSAINRTLYEKLLEPQVGICRVRHDKECMVTRAKNSPFYTWLARNYSTNLIARGIPESVRYNGGRGNVKLSAAWQQYLRQHVGIGPRNPSGPLDALRNAIAFGYISRLQSGWVNYGPWPTIEQVTWGGAFVVVTRIEGNRCYIESYDNSKQPGDYARDYLQLFSTVYSNDRVAPEPTVYTFPIRNASDGPLWMNDYDLCFVRPL